MTDSTAGPQFLAHPQLQELLDLLIQQGYQVIGPTISQQAIVYRPITSVSELPRGWSDRQGPGTYRLCDGKHDRYFYFNASPESWKKYLFPSRCEIGTAVLDDDGWHFETPQTNVPKYAFVGVRACDLAAIAVQDRVLATNTYVDAAYKRRRDAALLIAVECSTAAATCFCTSMGSGPECETGFDLVMTETDSGFIVSDGSAAGRQLLERLNTVDASDDQRQQAQGETQHARRAISKRFDNRGVANLLMENLEHPNWAAVAERCLSCGNCTMVCPTCFCSTVEEVAQLDQTQVSRVRSWDSCFNIDLSYTAGGIVRSDIRSRYRQWLTHKLATWQDQFDVSGCTGCGRCITWCPVGIDLTEEVDAMRPHATTAADPPDAIA